MNSLLRPDRELESMRTKPQISPLDTRGYKERYEMTILYLSYLKNDISRQMKVCTRTYTNQWCSYPFYCQICNTDKLDNVLF